MPVESVPLSRITSLDNVVRFLTEIGAPVERGLRHAKLPVLFREQPNAWLPAERTWAFTQEMARREGITELGLLAALKARNHSLHPSIRTRLELSPTLYSALRVISALARRQASDVRIWFEDHGEQVLFCHAYEFDVGALASYERDWFTIQTIITFLRHHLGRDWQPNAIFVRSPRLRSSLPLSIYEGCDVHVGSSVNAVSIERRLLCRADRLQAGQFVPPSVDDPPVEFTQSVRSMLRPYIASNCDSIDLTAEILRLSRRSLQRRLSKVGMTYSKLIQLARFDAALELMQDDDMALGEIALRLGYSDQTAFSRAFRHWAGVTPREFRRRQGV